MLHGADAGFELNVRNQVSERLNAGFRLATWEPLLPWEAAWLTPLQYLHGAGCQNQTPLCNVYLTQAVGTCKTL